MNWKDTITFGSSGLDRAAELRNDPDALARLRASTESQTIVFWQGKPALTEDGSLATVGFGDPVLEDASATPIFIGRDGPIGWFAASLDKWAPDEVPDTLGAFADPSEQRHPALPKGARFVELRGAMADLNARSAELVATGKAILGWHVTHRFCAKCGAESEIDQAGWQRTCPACGAHHFPRTDPVVIMLILHGNSVLVGRSPHWPEGMYSLLAGFVEPGETLEAAVRREVFEEARVEVGPVDYVVSQPWPFPSSLMFGCVGRAETTEITIDPVEIEAARWVDREEMAEVLRGTHADIRPPRQGAVARFLIEAWLMDRVALP